MPITLSSRWWFAFVTFAEVKSSTKAIGILDAVHHYVFKTLYAKKGTASSKKEGLSWHKVNSCILHSCCQLSNHIKNGFFPLPTHESCASKVIKLLLQHILQCLKEPIVAGSAISKEAPFFPKWFSLWMEAFSSQFLEVA